MAASRKKPDPLDIFEVAFILGCGWTIRESPIDPDGPPLATQLTQAVNDIYATWRDASPAERIDFLDWLADDK
jgi:hypothetical protein